jgi:hypothetical protein
MDREDAASSRYSYLNQDEVGGSFHIQDGGNRSPTPSNNVISGAVTTASRPLFLYALNN